MSRRGVLRPPEEIAGKERLRVTFAMVADIAELKRAKAELRSTEDQFRSLFENSNDAVLLSTPEGIIEAANPEACRIFDRTEEEICQVGRAGLVDTTDPRLVAFLEKREQVGRGQSELTLQRKDGTKFLGEVSSAFYKDSSGVTKASVIIRNITERKHAEETLRHITEGTAGSTGEEFFRSLAQNLAHALEVRYCFVAECTDETKTRVRMLAFWAADKFADNVEYPLQGTPCEGVITILLALTAFCPSTTNNKPPELGIRIRLWIIIGFLPGRDCFEGEISSIWRRSLFS